MRVLTFIGLLAMAALSLSACNTVEGIGKDTRAMGSAIENAAQRTR